MWVLDANGHTPLYYCFYGASIYIDAKSYGELGVSTHDLFPPFFPVSINDRFQILNKATNVGAVNAVNPTHTLFYSASPGTVGQPIFTSQLDFTASIDNSGGILIFNDHAMFATSPTSTPVDLHDAMGRQITVQLDHNTAGLLLVHSSPSTYFAPGDPVHIKPVNFAMAASASVAYVNAKGVVGGSYADSSGQAHPCIWSSLDKPPVDLSAVSTGVKLME